MRAVSEDGQTEEGSESAFTSNRNSKTQGRRVYVRRRAGRLARGGLEDSGPGREAPGGIGPKAGCPWRIRTRGGMPLEDSGIAHVGRIPTLHMTRRIRPDV